MTTIERPVTLPIESCERARRRATDFLLAHRNADGSIGPVEEGPFYYRVPWALAVAGETGTATALVGWIRRHMLTPEGEVRGSISPDGGMNRQANTYLETCLAYGAHLLRQYDVSDAAMHFALDFQDPDTGGVYIDRERTGPDGPQIVFLTCQFGMSALVTGHPDEAERAGDFLVRLWERQPELPDRLYTLVTRDAGILTAPPEGLDMRHVVNDRRVERQYHYNGGMAAAFLGRLYAHSGESRWLDAARAYQAFSMGSTERQFETRQVCKSAWGAAVLSVLTHEDVYRDWLVRMGEWFVRAQEPAGYWENTPYLDPNPTLGSRITVTAEFIVHLDAIIGALADRAAADADTGRGSGQPAADTAARSPASTREHPRGVLDEEHLDAVLVDPR